MAKVYTTQMKTRTFNLLLTIGIALSLLIAITTFHPDLRAYLLGSKIISQGQVLSFYDNVSKLPAEDPVKQIYGDDIFIYQPLAYLIPAILHLPFISALSADISSLIQNSNAFLASKSFYLPFLLLKLPALLFTLLTFFLLPKFFSNKKDKQISKLLWLFSPVVILVSSIMAQSDVMIAFFILLGLYFVKKNKLNHAVVSIAISALIKPIGLILIPLIAISQLSNLSRLKTFLLGMFTFTLGVLPYIQSPAYKMYALLAQHTAKSTLAGITIASGNTIPWFFIAYFAVLLGLISKKIDLFKAIGLAISSSLFFSHFHPQWFIWILPWLIYYAVTSKKYLILFAPTIAWLIILFSFEPSLHLGSFFPTLSSIKWALPSSSLYQSLVSLARAFLIVFPVYLIFYPSPQE